MTSKRTTSGADIAAGRAPFGPRGRPPRPRRPVRGSGSRRGRVHDASRVDPSWRFSALLGSHAAVIQVGALALTWSCAAVDPSWRFSALVGSHAAVIQVGALAL